ncbi:MAG: lipid-A-disaccharide synthase [Bacteroidota bacterium]|nr:lipid-A-disaccharide synthase [Bacteroidota bacterium]
MKLYIIAGEASGDLHGSNLIKGLKDLVPAVNIRAWGGDKMQRQGAVIVKHIRDLAFMGFKEVVANMPAILANFRQCKKDIENFAPDAVVFIDYPGFNLRMAKWAKKKGFKTIYYISPQLWAWKESRIHQVKTYVDEMLVILPFENEFYARHHYRVQYVGHPLLDVIKDIEPDSDFKGSLSPQHWPVIALLPGSRSQEIKRMLPVMLSIVKDFPDHVFVVAGAPAQEKVYYDEFLNGYPDVKLVFENTYKLLSIAEAAVVASGTATLEAALFKVPEVVCYKGAKLSYAIGRQLVKVKFISLVNLIMEKPVVKELIQHECNKEALTAELKKLIHDKGYRHKMLEGFDELSTLLGEGGASARSAKIVVSVVNS